MQPDLEQLKLEVEATCKKASAAAECLANASPSEKNKWIQAMADALDEQSDEILKENDKDMQNGLERGMSPALLDRLKLTPERVHSIADSMRFVTKLEDPVGKTISTFVHKNGLRIEKISVPLGVIGFIFEARPNVTADAAGLSIKSGNAVILRGGSEAIHSSAAIVKAIVAAGTAAGMPDGAVQLLPNTSHDAVSCLLKMDKFVDVIIPRGGERLIRTVMEQSTIPVLKNYKGVCHVYVDKNADLDMALNIIVNGKCQRPGVCNAVETVLLHKDILPAFAERFHKKMLECHVELRADDEFRKFVPDVACADENDYYTEYLALILAVRTVASVEEAVAHVNKYGTGHSEAIITNDNAAAGYFQNHVDAAAVYWNASTRFTDGGEFGMGAEIGISTDKLHARGPMGLPELTTYKYKIYGTGQTR